MSTPSPSSDRELQGEERHVLVVNQHGDNTGDEAAIRAMLSGLTEQLAPVRFTVLHQFRERASEVVTDVPIRWIPLVLPRLEAVRLVLYGVLRAVGVRARRLLGPVGRSIIDAYESADLVISAPGGPYFGDPYWKHEPVHWFYVWLARWHGAPTALYAPSAGPFTTRPLNPLRRLTYRCFDVVTVREERSAEHLRALMGPGFAVEVTADSALQEQVAPRDRHDWTVDLGTGAEPLDDRFLLVVSAIDHAYPGDPDPAARRERYDRSIVAAIERVVERVESERLADAVNRGRQRGGRARRGTGPRGVHAAAPLGAPQRRAVPDRARSTTRPRCVLGGRRRTDEQPRAARPFRRCGPGHRRPLPPAVFAVSAGVPVLCIPYEHKAAGLMEAAGQHDHVVDLREVSPERLVRAVDALLDDQEAVARELARVEPELRRRSRRTTEAVAALLTR